MPQLLETVIIKKVKRTRKTIAIAYEKGGGKFSLNETDNPLPEFLQSLDALAAVLCSILHEPETYVENLRIIGLIMGEQGEADTVSILAQKSLSDASKAFQIATPPRLLAHPTEPGSYTPPLTEAEAAMVYQVVENAKEYIGGNRAQGQITFEKDEKESDPDGTDPLPFHTPEASPAAPEAEAITPKRKRKAKGVIG